ncbi:MAG TPA: GNAT family N-acetyltransferase [Gemmatimonadaceae bacterium]|nr:GNAT family N-acetyltransferase [Gemmatimonadaceae bacterium]
MQTLPLIRRCSADDAPTLASLGARLFTETYGPTHPEPELSRYLARSFSVEGVQDEISRTDVSMFLVEDSDGVPMAYAYLRHTPESPAGVEGVRPFEIVRFYVDAVCQGRGLGASLMQACFSDAIERGADVIWLQVWKEAPWAVGFYHRMGFSVVGSAPFYFGEQIGDDHIMSRPL